MFLIDMNVALINRASLLFLVSDIEAAKACFPLPCRRAYAGRLKALCHSCRLSRHPDQVFLYPLDAASREVAGEAIRHEEVAVLVALIDHAIGGNHLASGKTGAKISIAALDLDLRVTALMAAVFEPYAKLSFHFVMSLN